jgi:hypothetical protein
MTFRHPVPWLSGIALLSIGAICLFAQQPQPPREGPAQTERDKLRAKFITLQTEVEMARFDYELARDSLLEELKIFRGLKMGFEFLGSFQITTTIKTTDTDAAQGAPSQESEEERKKAAEEAQEAERREQEYAAQTTAAVAKAKVELTRLFTLLSEKRLDLEDAERQYRETSP